MTGKGALVNIGSNATYVSRPSFLIATSLFLALASISAAGKAIWRAWHRHTIRLDDYILCFGLACLAGGTATVHLVLPDMYADLGLSTDANLASDFDADHRRKITSNAALYLNAFQCLIWTTIFSAKFSFLAFLWESVSRMYKMRMLYMAVVMVTVVCWAFVVAAPFIACPHIGAQAAQCSSPAKDRLYRALLYMSTTFDCSTTILVISIPGFILEHSQVKTYQRLAIGTYLCLATGIIATAILRSSKPTNPHKNARDTPLQTFLLYLESCIAITLVVLASSQNLLCLRRTESSKASMTTKWPPTAFWDKRNGGSEEYLTGGIRTFVRRGSRPKCGLVRAESVLRTREVVVEVHYEKRGDKHLSFNNSWVNGRRISESSEAQVLSPGQDSTSTDGDSNVTDRVKDGKC